MRIWIGLLDTRHFSFLTTGHTQGECKLNMRLAWIKHCEQRNIEDNWMFFDDSVQYYETELGQTLRDGTIIEY